METATDSEKAIRLAEAASNECLAGRVRRLSRVVTNVYDRALQPYGITANQVGILVSLLAGGATSPAEIGARLQMEKSTVSRALDRTRKSGWIDIEGSGPRQTVSLTDSGIKMMAEIHGAWEQAQKKTREILGDDGADALLMLAERLRNRS